MAEYTAQFERTPIVYYAEYTEDGALVASPEQNTFSVIFAAYKDGVLVSLDIEEISFEGVGEKLVVPDAFEPEDAEVKVMLWKSLDGMKPMM